MNFIEVYQQAEGFVAKNESLRHYAELYKSECALGSIKEIDKTFEEYKQEKRCLRVGIIGRVKAGKSSLLNALLFDGKDILPKAATPMTAALTVMEYSDTVSAEAEFFDQEDIEDIRQQYERYKEELEKEEAKLLAEAHEREKKRGSDPLGRNNASKPPKSDAEIQERAMRQAHVKMKINTSSAAYEHYPRIQQAMSTVAPEDLAALRHIEADSIEDLMGKLDDYVSADGRYMPLTKSVTLRLPIAALKELEVVDTPGINDPVQSRGQRTEEMLQKCDVVLLVSPSGQFLSAEDMELMDRLVTREGVQEIYIIASQADNQLVGSGGGLRDPLAALKKVGTELMQHAHEVLSHNQDEVYQQALAHSVICTSGAAFSMHQRFEKREDWDGNLQIVWRNLSEQYPDYFDEPESARQVLRQLANIDRVHSIFTEVKSQKDAIIEQKLKDLQRSKNQALGEYLTKIYQKIQADQEKVRTNDVAQLQKQIEILGTRAQTMRSSVGNVYGDLIGEMDIDLSKQMKTLLRKQLQAFNAKFENAQGSEEVSTEVEDGRFLGFLWMTYKTVYYDVVTIAAGKVRNGIDKARTSIQDELGDCSKEYRVNWRKKLYRQVSSSLRGKTQENDEYLDIDHINSVLRMLMNQIPDPEFELEALPKELRRRGTLKGYEAEEFIEVVEDYMSQLNGNITMEINHYIKQLVKHLNNIHLGDKLTETLLAEIQQQKKEVENKQASLYRYDSMLKELGVIMEAQRGMSL